MLWSYSNPREQHGANTEMPEFVQLGWDGGLSVDLGDWLVGRSVGWLEGRSVGWLEGRSFSWVGLSVYLLQRKFCGADFVLTLSGPR